MDNERYEEFQRFIGEATPSLISDKDLDDALYFASENGLWTDWVESVSPEQAIMC